MNALQARRARAQNKAKTEELFDLFIKITEAGCWEWQGKRHQRLGYGELERIWNGKRYVIAHRLAYAVLVGEIPDGYTIDHLCRNRCCVNPKHLEAVTLAENLRRKGMREKCGRGHRYDVVEFKKAKGLYPRCSICRKQRKLKF